MRIPFSKYQGAGNDFIIIDNRALGLPAQAPLISKLCHRHYGIGADGLMLLERDASSHFAMRYFNADGGESTMCGNGGRCIAMFAARLGIAGNPIRFQGADGPHVAQQLADGQINLKMRDVHRLTADEDYYLIDTGSPHYVRIVEDVERVDVACEGRLLRSSFQPDTGGVNVNFVQITPQGLSIRTYERGVEAETLACGTGAVASAIAANHWLEQEQDTYVIWARGGRLVVSFNREGEGQYHNIWLKGPAAHVFDGTIQVERAAD